VIIKDLYTPHIIKRGKVRLAKPFAVFLAIVFLGAVIAVSFIFVIPNVGLRLPRRYYYILTLGTTTNLVQAEILSQQVKNSGGAGFIINEGVFYISAAAYLNREEAEIVAARMDGFNTGVFTVGFARRRIREFDNRADNRALRDILLFPLELIDFVIYQNLRLDSGATTDSATIYLLNTRAGLIEDSIRELYNLVYGIYEIGRFMIDTLDFFQDFLYDFQSAIAVGEEGLLTHRLKYFAIKHILAYRDLLS